MTSQTNNDLLETSNNNVIKIPYSDNQEDSILDTSLHINGFTIIEVDKDKKEYNDFIPSYEEDQFLGKKQKNILKSKAKIVENYYASYLDMKVPNVNCSKCLLGNFTANELLYFKDRKTLIAYLKYCFIYQKKSLFMNHLIYKNNKFDLFQINQSYYNGWKFAFPKIICRSCFIQMINMEYLIFNIKNIICDTDRASISFPSQNKKVSSFTNNKRRRPISKNQKHRNKKEQASIDDKINEITSQITPITISISENYKVKEKRRRITNSVFKRRRKIKNQKRPGHPKYNENIVYDQKSNSLIINKKAIANYQIDEDSIIIGNIISPNEEKEKDKDKEIIKLIKKKENKIKLISTNKSEIDSLSNKKTVKKEKKAGISSKDSSTSIKEININKNKNYQFKQISSKNNEPKNTNTIIINNINKAGEINMNSVGLIQMNSGHQYENNTLNNYSNKEDDVKNSLKQNNYSILANKINNNDLNNYFNYRNLSTINQLFSLNNFMNENRIYEDLILLKDYLIKIGLFTQNIKAILSNIYVGNISQYQYIFNEFLKNLIFIINRINQSNTNMDYVINIIKSNIVIYQNNFNPNYDMTQFIFMISELEKYRDKMKSLYNALIDNCLTINSWFKQILDNIIIINA